MVSWSDNRRWRRQLICPSHHQTASHTTTNQHRVTPPPSAVYPGREARAPSLAHTLAEISFLTADLRRLASGSSCTFTDLNRCGFASWKATISAS